MFTNIVVVYIKNLLLRSLDLLHGATGFHEISVSEGGTCFVN